VAFGDENGAEMLTDNGEDHTRSELFGSAAAAAGYVLDLDPKSSNWRLDFPRRETSSWRSAVPRQLPQAATRLRLISEANGCVASKHA